MKERKEGHQLGEEEKGTFDITGLPGYKRLKRPKNAQMAKTILFLPNSFRKAKFTS